MTNDKREKALDWIKLNAVIHTDSLHREIARFISDVVGMGMREDESQRFKGQKGVV